MKLYAWLSGVWAGMLWFFTFGVAWNLFRIFPREHAGRITTALFPAYFAVTIAIGAIATVALWLCHRGRMDAVALALQIAAVAALSAILFIIQPAMATHAPGTPGFARLHGISMAMNLFALLAVPAASIVVLARRKE